MNVTKITDLVRGMRDRRFGILPVLVAGILGLAVYAFLEVADEVGENEFERIDSALLLMFRDGTAANEPIGPPWLQETVVEITSLGGYPILSLLVAIVVGYLLVLRLYGPALYVLISIVLGTALSHVLKLLYERPRPDLVDHLVQIHTPSFPSGHATMSTVVYLTLASLIARLVDDRSARIYVMTVAILLSFAVGVSRVYLGVHWPSDVAAGWALGAAWASLVWLVVSMLRAWGNRQRGTQ